MKVQSANFRQEINEQNILFKDSLDKLENTFLESLKKGFLLQSQNFEQKLIIALKLQSTKKKEEIKNDSDRPNESTQKDPTDPQ